MRPVPDSGAEGDRPEASGKAPPGFEAVTLGEPEQASLVRDCPLAEDFLLAGLRVRVHASERGALRDFRRLYAPLAAPGGGPPPALDIRVRIRGDGRDREAVVACGAEGFRIRDPAILAHLFPTVAHLALKRVRGHLLVHAAAVARGGRAIVVAGASGRGKSTLAACLALRGGAYLSDEIVPVCLHTAAVIPFPLRLGVREGPANVLTSHLRAERLEADADRKRLVDPRAMGLTVASGPVPLHAVAFLDAPDFSREPEVERLPPATGVLELVKEAAPHQAEALVRDSFDGRVVRLVEAVARATRGVAFHRLRPGRLEPTVEALEAMR